ncbi:MAG TPA: maleylpyruvate isomerase N-terminal domain-containing protein [Rugosimonospora sp.]|nr:maleylpyruvate isomerase N-terminal domain-containing protein [Rugosimonospora sp.]
MTVLGCLEAAWHAWARVGESLDGDRWRTPTRLPGWTVADLYAHHGGFPVAVAKLCAGPAIGEPPTYPDAAALLAMFNGPGGPAHTMSHLVRDHAVGLAQGTPRAELLSRFTDLAPRALAAASTMDPTARVSYGGMAVLLFGEVLRIGLMEAVVHYLDLARALDLPVPGPVDGEPLRETVRLLAAVADPLAFVENATGRSAVEVLPVVR